MEIRELTEREMQLVREAFRAGWKHQLSHTPGVTFQQCLDYYLEGLKVRDEG